MNLFLIGSFLLRTASAANLDSHGNVVLPVSGLAVPISTSAWDVTRTSDKTGTHDHLERIGASYAAKISVDFDLRSGTSCAEAMTPLLAAGSASVPWLPSGFYSQVSIVGGTTACDDASAGTELFTIHSSEGGVSAGDVAQDVQGLLTQVSGVGAATSAEQDAAVAGLMALMAEDDGDDTGDTASSDTGQQETADSTTTTDSTTSTDSTGTSTYTSDSTSSDSSTTDSSYHEHASLDLSEKHSVGWGRVDLAVHTLDARQSTYKDGKGLDLGLAGEAAGGRFIGGGGGYTSRIGYDSGVGFYYDLQAYFGPAVFVGPVRLMPTIGGGVDQMGKVTNTGQFVLPFAPYLAIGGSVGIGLGPVSILLRGETDRRHYTAPELRLLGQVGFGKLLLDVYYQDYGGDAVEIGGMIGFRL